MFKDLDDDDRRVHRPHARSSARSPTRRRAGRCSGSSSTGRTATLYSEAGLIPPKDETPARYEVDAATTTTASGSATPPASCTRRCSSATSRWPGCSPSSRKLGTKVQPRAHRQPPLRPRSPRTSPGCRCSTRRERRPDAMSRPTDKQPYDAIVVGGGHNGLVNGAYLAKAGLQDADPRAAPPRRRRGDHRGAAPGLLVHDVLLRAEPAAAGDHPRARAGQARLHAAADAVDLRARWRTATTCCSAQDHDAEHQGDRAALASTTPTPTTSTSHDMDGSARPSSRCSTRSRPNIFSDDPEDLIALAWLGSRFEKRRPRRAARRRPAADRQRRRLPRRLLRDRHPQGLPRLVEHHRHQGRADVAGLRAGAAVPQDGRARRRTSARGRSTRAATAASPRCSRARRRRSAPRSSLESPVDRVITKDGRATGVALADGTELTRDDRRQRARPAAHLPRAGRPARAARATSSRTSTGSGSRARRRR